MAKERKIKQVTHKIPYKRYIGFYSRKGYQIGAIGVVRIGRQFVVFMNGFDRSGFIKANQHATLYSALMTAYRVDRRLKQLTKRADNKHG